MRVAVIGTHGMGQTHIREFSALRNVEVAAICDVDENLFEEVIQKNFTGRGKPRPKTYTDLRKLYEDKEIDAVSVVTPNHWHALAGIWAMQAGKHVTIEKPVCHDFFFYGSKGFMVKHVDYCKTFLGRKREPGPTGAGLANHYQNFIDAIRLNDRSVINGSIQEGHYSAALVHLANISYRLGRSLRFDPKTEQFIGDEEANRMLRRECRPPFVVPDKV